MIRVLSMTCAAAMFAFIGVAQADNHHNGHDAVKGKPDGRHEIHSVGNHTAHAHVKGGKVSHVEVNHKTKGSAKVTKYRSGKKHHASADQGIQHQYVSLDNNDDCGAVIAWVGFGYINDFNQIVIIWFPVTLIIGGDSGCVDYNP